MKIQELKNIFPDHRVARYNLAAWQRPESSSVYFIGREVIQAGTTGEPDNGVLKLFEVNDGLVVQERTIWHPMYDGINLEDPRALEIPNESLLIGLTAVLRDKNGNPVPFPAIIKIGSINSWNKELPPFLIVGTFGSGKNITPVDKFTYLFRPDDAQYNHKILVFSLHHQIPEKLGDIDFPRDLPWAKWRVGTTMPPIWLDDHEALFIIHGISIQVVDGLEKYVYSIGRAKLTRHNNTFDIKVASEPILTPDDFINENVLELHPELRRVVYSCGGIVKRDKKDALSLYVNVGDRTTFEVEFSINELKQGLF